MDIHGETMTCEISPETSSHRGNFPRVAVIPAAGRGRRLSNLDVPKALVEVDGEPILARLVRHLVARGVEEITVVTGWRAPEVEAFAATLSGAAAVRAVFNAEWQRGMVESLLCAGAHVSEECAVLMGDHVFSEGALDTILGARLAREDLVCVLGDSRQEMGSESAVFFSAKDDRVVNIGRGPAHGNFVDAGAFVVRPEFFELLAKAAARGATDFCDSIRLACKQQAVCWLDAKAEPWFDVDTPEDLVAAERALRGQRRRRAAQECPREGFAESYEYGIQSSSVTKIVVERGLVAAPALSDWIPAPSSNSPVYVITDTRVNELYGAAFVEHLRTAGVRCHSLVVEEGESAKSLDTFARLANEILEAGIDERSLLVSLGGGVVCNLSGFLASTLYRGIGLVHFPTTVMAQCDAAISHKQAINGSRGKNAIGSYYAPNAILIDVDVLCTLSDRQISDGLAEVIKHAISQDRDMLEYLLDYAGPMRSREFLERVIRRNIELKCDLVRFDPKEHREGLALHYGHTIGHAVEERSGFVISHGEAVAVGMMVAARLACLLDLSSEATLELHRRVLTKYHLPTEIPQWIAPEAVLAALRFDKKYLVEGTRFTFVSRPGQLFSRDGEFAIPVSNQLILEAIRKSYGGLP